MEREPGVDQDCEEADEAHHDADVEPQSGAAELPDVLRNPDPLDDGVGLCHHLEGESDVREQQSPVGPALVVLQEVVDVPHGAA